MLKRALNIAKILGDIHMEKTWLIYDGLRLKDEQFKRNVEKHNEKTDQRKERNIMERKEKKEKEKSEKKSKTMREKGL